MLALTDFDSCPACEGETSALHPMGEGYLACNLCDALFSPEGEEVFDNVPSEVQANYEEFSSGW
jgi:hypothetical protein